MPWSPELFSAPVLAQLEHERKREFVAVPFFDGLLAAEPRTLVESFAVEPELHDPLRGRVKGKRPFEAFAAELSGRLRQRGVSIEEVNHVVADRHGFEEVVLHFEQPGGPVQLPVAIVADLRSDGLIEELRIYFSNWALGGRHANRPPLLQPDPQVRESDVVGDYQRALAAGDLDAIVELFEAEGYTREPAGGAHIHRGRDSLRAFYAQQFSNGGGVALEHCAAIDDGSSCALEYNVVRWGDAELLPEAGLAVYERGAGGKLAAARIYDDAEPPVRAPT